MAERQAITVHWHPSAAQIPEALWTRCFPPRLEGRWWYESLERAGLEDQFKFSCGVIQEHGAPLGIVPVFMMDLPLDIVAPDFVGRLLRLLGRLAPSLRFQRTLFVGSPCADEGTLGLAPGIALEQVAPAVQDALARLARLEGAAMIVWKDFPQEAWPALEALATARAMFPAISYPNTRMQLECADFEGFLRQIGKSRRENLRKKLRRSHAMGPLEVEVLQQPNAALQEKLFALFWQTYCHGQVKFERLTPQFFMEIARCEATYFVVLRDPGRSGEPIAFNLVFLCGDRAICKYIGIDYTYAGDWNLYFRLAEAVIDWALRQGVHELQSGQTSYTAKFDLGLRPVPLTNFCKHRNRLFNRMLAAVARSITWETLDRGLADYVRTHRQAEAQARWRPKRRSGAPFHPNPPTPS